MQIEAYFHQHQLWIDACALVQSFNVSFDKRGTHQGVIRNEILFMNGSMLYVREFIDVESGVERLMYSYHYVDSSNQLIFRYDNTGHHKKLNLPTYPHHKHVGQSNTIAASTAPDFAAVLREIENEVVLSEPF